MEDTLLTPLQCAERRGVSRQAINAAIKRGDIPTVRLGRAHGIRVGDCDAYIPMKSPAERGLKGAKKYWGKPDLEDEG